MSKHEKKRVNHKDKSAAAGSNRRSRVRGEKGSPQSRLRGELYTSAFERLKAALTGNNPSKESRYFEAIAIADSIISDRLLSLVQTTLHSEDDEIVPKGLGKSICKFEKVDEGGDSVVDQEFFDLVERVNCWRLERNEAIHGFVMVDCENKDVGLDQRLTNLKKTAEDGAKLAREVCDKAKKLDRTLKRMGEIRQINQYIQQRLKQESRTEITAVEAAQWLDSEGLLKDSDSHPGQPLRRMLRNNEIAGQEQRPNKKGGRWYIRRVDLK